MYRKRLPREIRVCRYSRCNNSFEVLIGSTQKYCCRQCFFETIRGIPRSKEVKEKIGRANSGRKCKEKTKELLREANLRENSSRWIPREIRLCACGECGETFECRVDSKQRFIHGHHNKVKSYRKQQSKNKKGKSFPKLSKAKEGHEVSEKTREILREAREGKTYEEIYGDRADEVRGNIGKSVSVSVKQLWQTPEYIGKQIKARHAFPNKPEKFIDELLQKLFPGQWKYVGSGDFIVEGTRRNPDFIHVTQKKIIEHFGDYYHGEGKTGIPNDQHEQERIELFAQFGYQTLIIWEHELEDTDNITNKILEFNNG